jgi:YfiH family protein
MTSWLTPDWPVPENIGSAITIRQGGVSRLPFNSNNLALHVNDDACDVQANRKTLMAELGLLQPPLWLDQCHGTDVVYIPDVVNSLESLNSPERENSPEPQNSPEPLSSPERENSPEHEKSPERQNSQQNLGRPDSLKADASYTDQVGQCSVVMTADCLPVLFCDRQGTRVAAAHAGWRGLCQGILRNTVAKFEVAEDVMAYLGPAIGPKKFEVGSEVLEEFLARAQDATQAQKIKTAFRPLGSSKYLADLYALARAELFSCGVTQIYGGQHCTFSEPERFYSFRREVITGRQASLIWLKSSP